MEETTPVLFDEGALVRYGSAMRLTKPLGELKIPPTAQEILAARIARLPTAARELLQTLAVIRRELDPEQAAFGVARQGYPVAQRIAAGCTDRALPQRRRPLRPQIRSDKLITRR